MRINALLACLALTPLALLPACNKADSHAASHDDGHDHSHDGHDHSHDGHDHDGHDHAPAARTDTYTGILGIVAQVENPADPASEFKIQHEHIPDFKTKDGTVFVTADGVPGMKSMTMAFPPAEGVDLSAFQVGDKVRFTFAVNYGGSPPWHLTSIEKIDPATEIDFSNKPAAAPADQPHDPHDGHDHTGHDHP